MSGHRPTDAWLRGGAGPMRDRRSPRGGARNDSRDLADQAAEEAALTAEEADLLAHVDEDDDEV